MAAEWSLLAFVLEYWWLGAATIAMIVLVRAKLLGRVRLLFKHNPHASLLRVLLVVALLALIFVYYGTLDLSGFDAWAAMLILPALLVGLLAIFILAVVKIRRYRHHRGLKSFYWAILLVALFPVAHFLMAVVLPTL